MGKIGVFDSGFGGLSILKEIVKVLPQYDYIYLGDSARAPYGDKSQETIYEYTKEGIDFLFNHGAEIIILACNSASSEALRKIQQEYILNKYRSKKVLGVIIPACEAVAATSNRVGVLGTEATVSSHAFTRELQKINPNLEVFEIAAPLLVPLIEAGEEQSESAKLLVKEYVAKLPQDIDALILGCTHYSFLIDEFHSVFKGRVIAEGKVVAERLQDYLSRHSDIEVSLERGSKREFYTTDATETFDKHGSRFFGKEIKSIKTVL